VIPGLGQKDIVLRSKVAQAPAQSNARHAHKAATDPHTHIHIHIYREGNLPWRELVVAGFSEKVPPFSLTAVCCNLKLQNFTFEVSDSYPNKFWAVDWLCATCGTSSVLAAI
jgi:hypothetical protein